MSKPKIHFIVNRTESTGCVQAKCGKWLMNPKMQASTRQEDVTCKFCMTMDHPACEDSNGNGPAEGVQV